jgi:hypothetical protein
MSFHDGWFNNINSNIKNINITFNKIKKNVCFVDKMAGGSWRVTAICSSKSRDFKCHQKIKIPVEVREI